MYFDGEYRLVARLDVAPLASAVEALTEADWLADKSRQETYAPHRRTQTVGLVYDQDMRHAGPTVRPMYARLERELAPIMEAVARSYADRASDGAKPYFVRAILVRLDPHQSIGTHRDHGPSLARAHRIHVPIRTNPGAEFAVAGDVRHLPVGEAWEINNRKPHAVRNAGDEGRVHLILDYVVPGEVVDDPDGVLVA